MDKLHIIIDTREQRPWSFLPHLADCERGTLQTGDYALHGDGDNFAIERKSLNDFVSTIGADWDRFQREINRMRGWPAQVVIVEANLIDIVDERYNGTMQPSFICKRIAQLAMQGVCVLFCGDVECAAGMAYKVLKERAKQKGLQ